MKATTTSAARPCRRCGKRHACWYNLARCLYPKAAWISGEGPVALESHCGRRRDLTVTLHADVEDAEESRQSIDDAGCGSRCVGAHRIVHLAERRR